MEDTRPNKEPQKLSTDDGSPTGGACFPLMACAIVTMDLGEMAKSENSLYSTMISKILGYDLPDRISTLKNLQSIAASAVVKAF